MQIFLGVILGLVVVTILSISGHHYWLIRQQRRQQQFLDQRLIQALTKWQTKYPFIAFASLKSAVPVSIWHRDVLLFEYTVQIKAPHTLPLTAAELTALLNEILKLPAPVHVTECWQLKQTFHFDVAYLANQATIRYMHDMGRIKTADQLVAAQTAPVKTSSSPTESAQSAQSKKSAAKPTTK
ncbi:hypothetical protein ACFQHW_03665 [Lapidilactobacillus achengensis]|uniref:Uncharacterized protein n=1 Tax=Lapidilactobacillus achengensis TaxID=2486000 RepID=A0ABW1UP99_9LACO|nr:hypothetical protein [Lapidilactobacillus achengensis]